MHSQQEVSRLPQREEGRFSPWPAPRPANGDCQNSASEKPLTSRFPPVNFPSKRSLPTSSSFSIKKCSSPLFSGLSCSFCYITLALNCNLLLFPINQFLLVKDNGFIFKVDTTNKSFEMSSSQCARSTSVDRFGCPLQREDKLSKYNTLEGRVVITHIQKSR